jgi:hypothetical protein
VRVEKRTIALNAVVVARSQSRSSRLLLTDEDDPPLVKTGTISWKHQIAKKRNEFATLI